MGSRRLALGLTLACLLALSVAVSVEEGDKRSDLVTALTKPAGKSAGKAAPKQGVLDRAKNIAKDLIDKGKQLIGGVRALVKKEIEHVKTWFKKKWADIKQIYQFSRYCLNNKAPKKLKIKVPNSALCSTVRKSHPEFVQALEKIIEKVPEPTLQQTLAAEMAGEGDMHRNSKKPSAAGSRRSFLEIDSTNPGDPTHKWPTTLISYSLHPDLDPRAVVSLQWGVNHLEAVTCIRFQQVDTNATGAVIRVIPSTARCASELGYKGATGQNMWWGPQCAAGSSAHEFLHALGFDHTMNRLDRDLYLSVNLTRILTNKQHNFDKQSSPFQNYGPYDFLSILHYPANAFALRLSEPGLAEKTGRDSSVPAALNSPWNGQSQRDALTAGDIAAVKAIYCP